MTYGSRCRIWDCTVFSVRTRVPRECAPGTGVGREEDAENGNRKSVKPVRVKLKYFYAHGNPRISRRILFGQTNKTYRGEKKNGRKIDRIYSPRTVKKKKKTSYEKSDPELNMHFKCFIVFSLSF